MLNTVSYAIYFMLSGTAEEEGLVDKLSFFKKGTSKICGSLDIHEALHDCLLFLQSFMPLNCILFGLFEPEIDALRILALAADFPVKYSVDIPIALSAESHGLHEIACRRSVDG